MPLEPIANPMPKQEEPDASRRADEPGVLRNILEGTASSTGEEFFRDLVENLARALEVYGCFLTEYYPRSKSAKMLAFWTEDGWVEDLVYPVKGTPCEQVFETEMFFHLRDGVPELFPTDLDFKEMGIESYMGEPLRGIDDRIIGHLSVVDRSPLPEDDEVLALFRIFAARAAAERKRLDAEAALREREEKLARVFEGTMDAIIELDGDLRITQFNAAAAEIFGCPTEYAEGGKFVDLLSPDAEAAFSSLAEDLSKGSGGSRSAWLREGFQARRGDGSLFPAEASLSFTPAEGDSFYTVVLRNVEDRVRAAARIRALSAETEELRAELETLRGPGDMIGESPAFREVLQAIDRVAEADSTVLLTGETGTGKEVVARAIHAASRRSGKQLVRVNCAAIPVNLIESEFFGHEKGAFTGATAKREGRFELADGGTIFLDEIGELPVDLQPKLLRVLQEGEFEPVGGSVTRKVDVRVIAATNRDLPGEVSEGRFREDLYYRLNVYPIAIPPLRERAGDIALLAESFARKLAAEMGRPFSGLTDLCRELLAAYTWPGNVRELQNVIERALLTSTGSGKLDLATALPAENQDGDLVMAKLPDPETGDGAIVTDTEFRRLERENLLRALASCGWKISGESGTAALLGLNPSTLASRMRALGIRKPSS